MGHIKQSSSTAENTKIFLTIFLSELHKWIILFNLSAKAIVLYPAENITITDYKFDINNTLFFVIVCSELMYGGIILSHLNILETVVLTTYFPVYTNFI